MNQTEFEELVNPHLTEIKLYCYRMLGTVTDAEDVLQETLLRAWRFIHTYRGEGAIRSWLYRIASNASFDALKQKPRREIQIPALPEGDAIEPEAPLLSQKARLEPLPDSWLAVPNPDTETLYELRESISLAFMVAIQLLTPNQRAVLILRDVLGMSARETAEMLDLSLSAVNSALLRARKNLEKEYTVEPPTLNNLADILDAYIQAWEAGNIPELLDLLTSDVAFTMPPASIWFKGLSKIRTLFTYVLFRQPGIPLWKMLPVSANGQPAIGLYVLNPEDGNYSPYALQVLTLRGDKIMEATNFLYPHLFPLFGLPGQITAYL
jgi:RNA polymerase sigma-70 factor (ECF subfamily)